MRKYTIPQPMTVEYLLSDHLGSTSLTTDANGAKVLELRYKAWGEIRATWTSSPSTTPAYKMPLYQYTGQAAYLDDPLTSGVTEGFGLMFYNARWYDPYITHFVQADTIIPESTQGTQAWDRYAGMNNNPVRYNDPTGHCAWPLSIVCGAAIGAAVGATVSYVRQVATNVNNNGLSAEAFTNVDPGDIVASAAIGAIAGGLIGSGAGGFAILQAGGTGMAVSALGYTAAAGDNYDTSDMMISSAVGGLAGGLSGAVGLMEAPLGFSGNGAVFGRSIANAIINGTAAGVQTVMTGGQGDAYVPMSSYGGMVSFGVDVFLGPDAAALTGFFRSLGAEWFVNETTDCDGTMDVCKE